MPTYEARLKWKRYLQGLRMPVSGPMPRGHFMSLHFRDPDGQVLEIAATTHPEPVPAITPDMVLTGLHHITGMTGVIWDG